MLSPLATLGNHFVLFQTLLARPDCWHDLSMSLAQRRTRQRHALQRGHAAYKPRICK